MRRARNIPRVTPARLRAEGVFEVVRVPGSSVIFVSTEERLVLLHELAVAATFSDREAAR